MDSDSWRLKLWIAAFACEDAVVMFAQTDGPSAIFILKALGSREVISYDPHILTYLLTDKNCGGRSIIARDMIADCHCKFIASVIQSII